MKQRMIISLIAAVTIVVTTVLFAAVTAAPALTLQPSLADDNASAPLQSGPTVVSGPVSPADTSGLAPAPTAQPGSEIKQMREIPLQRRAPSEAIIDPAGDAALQTTVGATNMPAPNVNFEGVGNIDGVYPPDTNGEAGLNHYVQIVNFHMAVYSKTGTLLYGPFLPGDLWPSSDVCHGNDGDPVVLYDQLANRWLISQFALPNFPGGPFYQCIATSKSGTPTNNPGDWYPYTFLVNSSKMNDYPKLSVWPDAYYMTVNQFSAGGLSWAGTGVFAFDRAKMLNGQAATFQYFDLGLVNIDYGHLLPADLDGITPPPAGSPGYFVSVNDDAYSPALGADALRIWKFHADWTTPANSTFGLSGNPNATRLVASLDLLPCTLYGSRDCIPQPDTFEELDAIGDLMMFRAAYRNFGSHASIVVNHTVKADGIDRAGIRWYEVRNPESTPSLYQQGTYAPSDGLFRWMGSVAMDHVGNIALGYSVSSSSVYPSIRYAGRLATDPLGTLPQAETTIINGSGSQTGSASRWGDYSDMTVDPVDDCTFWYTSEYIQTSGEVNWQTRVASFKFPNCSLGPQGTLSGTITSASTHNSIGGAVIRATASITRSGATTSGAGGAYQMKLPVGTYVVTATAYGYLPSMVGGVVISNNQTTTRNFSLTPAQTYLVSGTVRDALTSWPLYARIIIDGYPGGPIWTNPATGQYSITLVGGTSYTFNVSAFSPGYRPTSRGVGPLSANRVENFSLNVRVTTCNAPGYGFVVTGLQEKFDRVAPPDLPAGWVKVIITDTYYASPDWFTNVGTRYPSGVPAHSLPNLVLFNSFSSAFGAASRLYYTPTINLSTLPTTTLSLWMYHDIGYAYSNDRIQVQVSTNGGTTWQNAGAPISRYIGAVGWAQHKVSLSAYVGRAIKLGFLGISEYGNDVHIDDILLGVSPCLPKSGGLVVGNVDDANTLAALNGVIVQNQAGYSISTVLTPDDPNVGDGFYMIFSPSGSQVFTATQRDYNPSIALVHVPLSGTVRQDFALNAGLLSYVPSSIGVTLTTGLSATMPLTLTNRGHATALFEIQETDQGGIPYLPSSLRPPYKRRVIAYWDPTETRPAGAKPRASSSQLLPNTWGSGANIPTGPRYRAASATCSDNLLYVFGGSNGSVVLDESWLYDPASNTWTALAPMPIALMNMEAACYGNYIYLVGGYTGSAHTNYFLLYNTTDNTWTTSTWPNVRTPMTAIYNNKLYTFGGDPGPSPETWAYDIVEGTWSGPLAPLPTAIRYGAAVTAGDYIYVVGGVDAVSAVGNVQRYDPATDMWATGPVLPNGRMNPMVAWYGDRLYVASGGGAGGDFWTGYNDTYYYTLSTWPGGTWTNQGETISQPVVAAATECVSNRIYGAGGTSGPAIYGSIQYLDDGQNCHIAGTMDVPWLGVAPISGTLAATTSQVVNVALDGSFVEPGIYKAALKTKHNTPYKLPNLPVTMTITVPPTWGKLIGNVSTFGYCDANQASLKGVTVTVESAANSWRLITDEKGRYYQWLHQAYSPLTVTINAPGYEAGKATGVTVVGQGTTTQDFVLRWLRPCLTASPDAITTTLSLDQNTTRPFRLANSGAATAIFSMTEEIVSAPAVTTLQAPPADSAVRLPGFHAPIQPAPFAPMTNVIQDGSFEATNPTTFQNPYWTQGSTTFGVVICSIAACGTGGGTARPRTGTFWVWFGGSSTGDVGYIQQPVTFSGPVWLKFYLWIGYSSSGANDWVKVSVDGQQVFLATGAQQGTYNTYQLVSVNLNGFGAGSHILRFDSTTVSFANFNIDDVSLDTSGGDSVEVPWLTESPVSGTVPVDSFLNTTIGFNANAAPMPGAYRAIVNVNSDDPVNPQRSALTTMIVDAPANWGVLTGTVRSLGYCDMNPAPLAGAALVLQGTSGPTRTVTSDNNGHYTIWLNALTSPYKLTTTAAHHLPAAPISGIVVNQAGAVTNKNVDLRANEPCLTYAPHDLSVMLPWGGSVTETLTLSNTGPAGTPFTVTEQAGGLIPIRPETPPAILIVDDDSMATHAFTTALTGLSYPYHVTTTLGLSNAVVTDLRSNYGVLIYAGFPSYNSAQELKVRAYLDAGGRFLIADNHLGYSYAEKAAPNLYATYFQATYASDHGSQGPIAGVELMAGVNTDISADPYPDSFTYGPDGAGIFANTAPRTDWAGMRIERAGYRAIYLAWDFQYTSVNRTAILAKALSWLTTGQFDAVPWLTEAPDIGNLAAYTGVQNVNVIFNAAVPNIAQPGTHQATLRIKANNVAPGELTIPVTMTVMPTATLGKLKGIVNTKGLCDVNPAPLANASVVIRDNKDMMTILTTDANGYYQWWASPTNNPYTVTASATDHLSNFVTVTASSSMTTTTVLSLRWKQPCVSVIPSSLSITVPWRGTITKTLTLSNTGAAGTLFTVTERAGGFITGTMSSSSTEQMDAPMPNTGWKSYLPLVGRNMGARNILVVDNDPTATYAFTAALTNLGYFYAITSTAAFANVPTTTLLTYDAVIYPNTPDLTQQTQIIAYLNANGRFLIVDNDLGYSYSSSTLYRTYLEALYVDDHGSDGPIAGVELMAGVNTDIGADPYPDSFTYGPDGAGIFANTAPRTDWAGMRIERAGYRAIYLAWDFQYTSVNRTAILRKALSWLITGQFDAVPWLTEEPAAGYLAADTDVRNIDVAFNAVSPEITRPGIYYATLRIKTNSVVLGELTIPVTMTVMPTTTVSELDGITNSRGARVVKPELMFITLFAPLLKTGSVHSTPEAQPASTPHANQSTPIDKLDPWVIDHTANGQTAEFLVVLTPQADLSAADRLPTKQAKGRYVYETLWNLAQSTQGSILTWLSEHHIPHRSYYIVNIMWVKANREAALALAARADVARLEGNPRIRGLPDQPLPPTAPPERTAVQSKDAPDTIEPGVQYVNAPQVWAMGFTGQGIVVGGQDTGYQWDHPALKNQYRGWNGATANHDYNWHDSIHSGGGSCGANSPFPCDDFGHGTHTMGTAVGSDGGANQIGVAPGAEWIGCRNMDQGNGTPTTYLECFEFFLAPYPVNGTPAQGDPSQAPDVTTNSWSCPVSEGCTSADVLQSAVEAQRAAGIMTVVAATNSGPSCSTISDPPSFYAAAYTVGALNTGTDTIASFSSRGPVTRDGSNRRKPDITAPGMNTRSSLPGNTYGNLSGTSMATPHVAGAVALLWSARPQLTNQISATEQVLDEAATHIPVNNVCSSDGWPNNVYGYGRIDVLAAVDMVPSVLLSGVVRDATTSTAIPQVLVQANSITHTFSTTTGLDGSYALKVLPGTYTVTVSAQNYNTATVSNINVAPGVTTTLDFTLTFQPKSGVILSPSLLTATGKIGQEVAYTLYFTNTGSLTDTFYASTNNNVWPVKASPLSATLSVQASSPLVVTVTVPITALDGLTDTVHVMLTNAHVTALSNLITAADIPYALFLPLFLQ